MHRHSFASHFAPARMAMPVLLILLLVIPMTAFSATPQESVCHTLYIGLPESFSPDLHPDLARAMLDDICAQHANGYTLWYARGGWTDSSGMLIREDTLVCQFFDISEEALTAVLDSALTAFQQSTILVSTDTVRCTYYTGSPSGN